jgi:murein DD-endopeptidase MepM/ murein hydrolase activator NlpD
MLTVGLVLSGVVASPLPVAAATGPFLDVSADAGSPYYSEFAGEIAWLDERGISTGWETESGRVFRPWDAITRDAMAAFLYRYAGSPVFTPTEEPAFVDVDESSEFVTEIEWLASTGISTGWVGPDGAEFRPFEPITRDAMAAFLYRFSGVAPSDPVPPSPFVDVADGGTFAREVSWLAGRGIAGGFDAPGGVTQFRPWNSITRDAMAAFLSRHDRGGLRQFSNVPLPAVTGEARVDLEVSVSMTGSWSPTPSVSSLQWLRDGYPIPGATAAKYTLTDADAGKALSVRVSGTSDGYLRAARQSAAVAVPNDMGSTLSVGEQMASGATLRSRNGAFRFDVNGDGNLTVSGAEGVIWQSSTRGNPVGALRLGGDGILSLTRPDGSLVWTSTPTPASSPRLEMRDDGELAVVRGDGSVLWSSRVQGARVFGLPFEPGQRWSAGGPHGDGTATWNALDFGPIAGQSRRVVAIADGVVGWVSCGGNGYLSVDHGGGWRSTYYHLVNERRDLIGTRVTRGTPLGDVGRTVPCGGGATFDHVHLRITYEGRPVAMNGFTLGGYTSYSSGTAYYGYWHDAAGTRVLTAPGGARCCLTAP